MPDIPSSPGRTIRPLRSTRVVSVDKATPDSLTVVFKATKASFLTGVTINNDSEDTTIQVRVGIRKESDSGDTWEPIASPILAAGEFSYWPGRAFMSSGDELVSYSTVTDLATVTPEVSS